MNAKNKKQNKIFMFGRKLLDDAYKSYEKDVKSGKYVGGFALIADDISRRYNINLCTGKPLPRRMV